MGYFLGLVTFLAAFLFGFLVKPCNGWSSDELALYDLVEEVNGNFYEILSLGKDASLAEIKRAYRRLSMELHPDRNQAEDANEQFRRIAAIYEVLKSPTLRKTYDQVLEFGLPDWRQPIYYIRRARKLSWVETLLVVLLISTITHYLMLWGAYLEKYWILESRSGKARKKELRQARKTGTPMTSTDEALEASISAQLADARPHLRNLLPFLIVSTLYQMVVLSPTIVQYCYQYFCAQPEPVEVEEDERLPAYMELTPQPVYEYAMADDLKPVLTTDFTALCDAENNLIDGDHPSDGPLRSEKWTCEELELLVKLTTDKYPAGTPDRWKLIGRALNRTPEGVAAMTGKLKMVKKDEYAKLLRASQSSSVVVAAANVTSVKNSDANLVNNVNERRLNNNNNDITSSTITNLDSNSETTSPLDGWSQHDQRLFETALQQFPKGTADRWDKIVNCVPNKTKQQCIDRFKYLSEMVRQRKVQHRSKK